MQDDSQFTTRAETMLAQCFNALEPLYEDELLDELEHEGELLTLTTDRGETFIISKHHATCELWLASPRSGGSHYRWDANSQSWRSKTGTPLLQQLNEDLRASGIEATL